jgi:molecular chaperone DnaK
MPRPTPTEDEAKRANVETRNRADGMAYEAEKFLKEHGDKAKVESCISELKEAVKANDTERMKKGLDELNSAMQAVSADMYAKAKQSGAQAGAPGAGAPPPSEGGEEKKAEGDVIDADFTMVDDEKKKKK